MRFLENSFDRYGRFVARRPLPFLIIPLITTALSTLGLLNFSSQDDIWDIYAPLDALSRVEEHALERFEAMSGANHYRIQVIVDRKDGGNLMNPRDMAELAVVNRFVSENLTVLAGGRQWAYHDVCGVYCNESNAFVIGLVQTSLDKSGSPLRLELTYPNVNAFHNRIFIGYSIGGLTMTENSEQRRVVRSFRLFILHYMINMRLPRAAQIRDEFEAILLSLFEHTTRTSPNISYALLSRDRELSEQRRITTTAIPYLLITGLLLTVFMILTLIDRPIYRSQCIEAIFGIVSPAMALLTTFGLVWGLGYPFSNILTVVPFLVITIGIDDAFLILAGWRHSSDTKDLEARMGESVARSGASVAVTSVTDVLCFGVGIISNMPVVRLFCLYTSVALTIDFVYQMTFFLAVTVYCGRRQLRFVDEERLKQLEKEFNNSTAIREEFNDTTAAGAASSGEIANGAAIILLPSAAPSSARLAADGGNFVASNSLRKKFVSVECFIDTLSMTVVRSLTFGLLAAHIVLSLYFCTLVSTDFDMENLYMRDSPLTPVSRKMQRFLLSESFVVNFALTDLSDEFSGAELRAIFVAMIDELERIPRFGMQDASGTTLWLRDYEAAVGFWLSEEESSVWEPAEMLRNYRAFRFDEKFIRTRMNEKGEEVIDSFSWFITYHNMHSFIDVQYLVDARREILKRYASLFTVFSHHPLEKVPTESAKSAPANFVQTGVSAVILMSVLIFLCILNVDAIFCVILSILSISAGTVGYLHVWDVNLDAVSLISMLMSIGFSVDYSAHVCYHYYTHAINGGIDGRASGTGNKKKRKHVQSPIPSVITSESGNTTTTTDVYSYAGTGVSVTQTAVNGASASRFSARFTLAIVSLTASSSESSSCSSTTEDLCCGAVIEPATDETEIRRRLIDTLNAVGWPVVQSGVSTVLGMIPLFFVDAYVVDVFWKTIVLVTALGMFHALVILPVLFISIADVRRLAAGRRRLAQVHSQSSTQSQVVTELNETPRQILGPIKLQVNE